MVEPLLIASKPTSRICSLEGNLLDIELCQGLSVASLHSVMLLAAHLEDGQLGAFQILDDLCFDGGLLQVGPSHFEAAVLLHCQDSPQLDGLPWLSLHMQRLNKRVIKYDRRQSISTSQLTTTMRELCSLKRLVNNVLHS